MSEFERPVRIDTIGIDARAMTIEAEPAERLALARRFDIGTLDALTATATVARRGADIVAEGHLSARLVQACVATGIDMPAAIDAPFTILFRAPPVDAADAELSEDECDVVFYDGGAIDLGEAVAETLALAIDPYPRSAGADGALREMGVLSEGEAGPFAALAGLKL